MGHVPPARTDSKVLWDETCWQKYTLWLQQYRDVVVSGLYGHMNIDHFMLLDTQEITIQPADSEFSREYLDDELSIQSATDYLEELRDGWARLPKPSLSSDSGIEFEFQKGKKDKKKKNKDKKKLGGEWAERYQLVLVSPSIVPNYFPTLRVFEYNITGLEDAVSWADYHGRLPTVDEPDLDVLPTNNVQDSFLDVSPPEDAELELRRVSDSDVEAEKKRKKKGKKGKKKKDKKKNKKGKGGDKSKDPNLVVPNPPDKSSPPGPAYSPQPLTLMSYTQYFANLTHINNDMVSPSEMGVVDEIVPARWREGKHGDKKPKHKEPKPRKFKFEVEYDTRTDKAYKLPDLTVRSFVDLAYRMGQTAKTKSKPMDMSFDDLLDEMDEHKDLGAEELEDLGEVDGFDSDGDDDDDDDDEVNAEKKKKKKGGKDKKKKKKKKKAKKLNKTWLEFLKRAFVGTMNDDEIKETFS